MPHGGNATLYVSNMDQAVRFYTEALGLPLKMRAGNHWAEVRAGDFVIGLHPLRPGRGAGVAGSVQIGLLAAAPLERTVATLESRGVRRQGEVIDAGPGGRFANVLDPDGNEIYLWESKAKAAAKPAGK